jgi:hypothetical protein
MHGMLSKLETDLRSARALEIGSSINGLDRGDAGPRT